MNLFRIRGIRLEVHFSFFLLLAFVAQEGWSEAGWSGVLWSVATILAFFTCVVLHELGHSFTAMHFGIGVRRILLMPIGGMAEFDDIPLGGDADGRSRAGGELRDRRRALVCSAW